MRTMKMSEDVEVTDVSGGTAEVLVLRSKQSSHPISWTIEADVIPADLRRVGAQFCLNCETSVPERDDEMALIGRHPPRFWV
ncbi:MAG: hypothetical protein IPK13_01650 [Deltaproteobacteria bacterium]|nr:hypothetical protein [Deltaproteobacteria bacterium]